MINVYKNVLDDTLYDELSSTLRAINFPWYKVSDLSHGKRSDDILGGYSHNCMSYQGSILSPYFYLFLNVLYRAVKQPIKEIYQVRAFMHTPSEQPGLINGIHRDLEFKHNVCLFYLNDSDGDTKFFDDDHKLIYSNTPEKNSCVLFDGSIQHSATTPSKKRIILNFNYIT